MYTLSVVRLVTQELDYFASSVAVAAPMTLKIAWSSLFPHAVSGPACQSTVKQVETWMLSCNGTACLFRKRFAWLRAWNRSSEVSLGRVIFAHTALRITEQLRLLRSPSPTIYLSPVLPIKPCCKVLHLPSSMVWSLDTCIFSLKGFSLPSVTCVPKIGYNHNSATPTPCPFPTWSSQRALRHLSVAPNPVRMDLLVSWSDHCRNRADILALRMPTRLIFLAVPLGALLASMKQLEVVKFSLSYANRLQNKLQGDKKT